MMTDNRLPYGALDVAARTLEDIPKDFKALYDGGKYRMRPEDIRRMGLYLARINRARRAVAMTLAQFKEIA